MATKKAAKKRGPASTILRFKKEWIFDPGPEWLRINRAALTRINQLKEDFAKRVNEAIKTGQQITTTNSYFFYSPIPYEEMVVEQYWLGRTYAPAYTVTCFPEPR